MGGFGPALHWNVVVGCWYGFCLHVVMVSKIVGLVVVFGPLNGEDGRVDGGFEKHNSFRCFVTTVLVRDVKYELTIVSMSGHSVCGN